MKIVVMVKYKTVNNLCCINEALDKVVYCHRVCSTYTEYLIREALEDGKGTNINGQNITNIRYADDTIILAESEQQLQHNMIDKLYAKCEQYIAMNVKKTKTMFI